MEKVDILIKSLEPQIEMKCSQIKQKRKEKLLTKLFIALAAALLTIPELLIFFGVSLISIFTPIIFASAVIIITLPILFSKGAEIYE